LFFETRGPYQQGETPDMRQAALFRGPRLLSRTVLLVSAIFCFAACESDQTVLEGGDAGPIPGARDGAQWHIAADRSDRVGAVAPQSTSPLANVANLAPAPSPPGPHIAKIKALGDNEWLKLGSPAADPKWGKPRGRSWGAKMPAAPNLRGGFLSGRGPHGYIKPDGPDAGYMDDDYWFYDINAHRWICIYPGTNTKTFTQQVKNGQIKVVNGQVVDEGGQPIPLGVLIHAWGQVTYNPDQSKFVFQSRWNGGTYLIPPPVLEGLELLKAQGNNGTLGSPWFYDPVTGRFERYPITGVLPEDGGEPATNQFLYVDSKKQYFLGGRYSTAFFDPVARKWTEVATKGQRPQGIDNAAYYDPKRDRIYLGGGPYVPAGTTAGDNFFIYDVKTATWSRPYPQGNFPVYFGSNGAFFNYDFTNDVAVLLSNWGQQIYIYNPSANTWVQLPSSMPAELVNTINSGVSANGFYDPVLNAFFLHYATDGEANGTMWVYRYKKGQP
jgi:hypothetical protein